MSLEIALVNNKSEYKKIRTGDLILTCSEDFLGYLCRVWTGSYTNHAGIFLWREKSSIKLTGKEDHKTRRKLIQLDVNDPEFRSKMRIDGGFKDGSDEPENELLVLDINSGVRTVPYYYMLRRQMRILRRGVKSELSETEYLDLLYEHMCSYKNIVAGLIPVETVKILANLTPKDKTTNPLHRETCVSFVIDWLKRLGYSYEQNVPQRHRQLHSSDHLLSEYNKSDILEEKDDIIYSRSKNLSQGEYFLFLAVIIILLVLVFFCIFIALPPISRKIVVSSR